MKASAGNKVLMLLENAPFRLDSRVYPEATTLAAAGYQVTVICPNFKREPWRESVDGVRVYRYPALFIGTGFVGYLWEYGYSLLAALILSLVVLAREGFDIIHAHNPPDTGFLIAALYKPFGKRFFYDQHDLAPEMYSTLFRSASRRVYQIMVWMERRSCQLADRIIVTNQSHRRMIVRRSGIAEEAITIVRNGPDPSLLRPAEPDPALRQAGKTTICYAGVMGRHDGVDYLLRAIRHLVVELGRGDVHCMLVGYGNAWPELRALSGQLGLDRHVQFVGWVEPGDVARHLNAADICVAPEPSNPYNDNCTVVKIAEYMAAGKPVVAFDLPEHRFTAEAAALYAAPNSERDFALKLLCLMDDPELRRRMGEAGRRRVESDLAWVHQGRRLVEVYESQARLAPQLT
ncbi:MAG: glycosyltransferase family 4 protein [Chloroflexales bacterium]|nr:glycosyltransferase family 4 protein [Chloroflexales bacterium]